VKTVEATSRGHHTITLTPLERRRGLSRDEFERDYLRAGRPVVIEDGAPGWVRRWTPESLAEHHGDAVVRATGEFPSDRAEPVHQPMALRELVDRIAQGSRPIFRLVTGFPHANHGDDFVEVLPALAREYLDDAPYRRFFVSDVLHHMLWMHPVGNHDHVYDNVNIQVIGRKRWILFPPSSLRLLYPVGAWQSPIDPFAPDLEKYPRFADACALSCEQGPGEVVFVPKFWWHCVETLEVSINLTTFVETRNVARLWRAMPGVPVPQRAALSLAGLRSVRWFGKHFVMWKTELQRRARELRASRAQ
jgi:hypothetical protein